MIDLFGRLWGPLSIRKKIIAVITVPMFFLVTVMTILVACRENREAKQELVETTTSIVRAMGQDLERIDLLDDQRAAVELADRMRSFRDIERVHFYNPRGEVVFSYCRAGLPDAPPPPVREGAAEFSDGALRTFVPLGTPASRAGVAFIQVATRQLSERRRRAALTIALVDFGVIVLGLGLACMLQSLVSRPMLELERAARAVAEKSDYSVRAVERGNDELSAVTAAFNAMLDQIELRDAALQEANDELERRVAERTRELAAARDAAQAANIAKDSFLANMSHEIRTPMAAILGYAELLKESLADDEDARDGLELIDRSGKYLLELISDILDLSKIAAGKLEIECIPCSPLKVIAEVISIMAVRAQEKGLVLEERCETSVPETICSDPTRIRQVLLNLVGNAIKFTETGSVVMAFRSMEAEGSSRVLEFEVRDTGIGIARKKLERIFEPFDQADSSMTRKYGGTGLGLSICDRLAKLLGGEITVKSEPGAGTVVTFRMRCDVPAGTPIVTRPGGSALEQDQEGPVSEKLELAGRILVVEDHPANQEVIRAQLRETGARVEVAGNGVEALEMCSLSEFDLILMDIQMPVMDGFEAIAELRRRGTGAPVIALTAHAMKGDRERCLKAGFDGYLAKPVPRVELIRQISAFLSSRSPAAPAQASS